MFKSCGKYFFVVCFMFGNLGYLHIGKSAVAKPTFSHCLEVQTSKKPAPGCVYRADTVSPEKVFENGFVVPENHTNNNVLDHVGGTSFLDSNFVATTEKIIMADSWVKNFSTQKWLYLVEPDENFKLF